jgi:hypothetical protein
MPVAARLDVTLAARRAVHVDDGPGACLRARLDLALAARMGAALDLRPALAARMGAALDLRPALAARMGAALDLRPALAARMGAALDLRPAVAVRLDARLLLERREQRRQLGRQRLRARLRAEGEVEQGLRRGRTALLERRLEHAHERERFGARGALVDSQARSARTRGELRRQPHAAATGRLVPREPCAQVLLGGESRLRAHRGAQPRARAESRGALRGHAGPGHRMPEGARLALTVRLAARLSPALRMSLRLAASLSPALRMSLRIAASLSPALRMSLRIAASLCPALRLDVSLRSGARLRVSWARLDGSRGRAGRRLRRDMSRAVRLRMTLALRVGLHAG